LRLLFFMRLVAFRTGTSNKSLQAVLAKRGRTNLEMSGATIRQKSTGEVARDLYLDLLVKSISNLIYGALPSDPWNDGLFRPDAGPGRNRESPAHSMVGLLRLENVRELAQRAIDEGIPGDFIETGVWRGGCCILMRGVLAANLATDRKVYVADSFAGLPPPNQDLFPVDAGTDLHTLPGLAVPLDEVRDNFNRYGLLDDRVVFVEGFFSDTLPKLDAGPFALIRLDGDMYESTYVALQSLYPKVSAGGFVIIDDYGSIAQCRRAVEDYRSKNGIGDAIHQIDFTGIWWQKSG
jgi:O-methyltransferase